MQQLVATGTIHIAKLVSMKAVIIPQTGIPYLVLTEFIKQLFKNTNLELGRREPMLVIGSSGVYAL